MAILIVAVLVLGTSGIAAFRIVSSHFSSSEATEWTRPVVGISFADLSAQASFSRPGLVYPYSVVPGGVRSPAELKRASAYDRLVAQHYAGFDYQHARVIEVREPKLVYVSYRMHDRIYWTSKRIRLHRGERLISDGRMTARERCGNQVSESAQKAVSPQEPPADRFEQPYAADGGTGTQSSPTEFASTLHSAPQFDGAGPGSPPLSSTYLFGPGASTGFPPVFPPPIPTGGGSCNTIFSSVDDGTVHHNCPKHPGPGHGPTPPPPPPPPPVVPEPGTIFLFASGALGIYLRYRKSSK